MTVTDSWIAGREAVLAAEKFFLDQKWIFMEVPGHADNLPRLGSPGTVSLSALSGRPVVVNFFASWCTVCASELPVFDHEAQLLKGRIDVVEVNALETGDGNAFARHFALPSSVTAGPKTSGAPRATGSIRRGEAAARCR